MVTGDGLAAGMRLRGVILPSGEGAILRTATRSVFFRSRSKAALLRKLGEGPSLAATLRTVAPEERVDLLALAGHLYREGLLAERDAEPEVADRTATGPALGATSRAKLRTSRVLVVGDRLSRAVQEGLGQLGAEAIRVLGAIGSAAPRWDAMADGAGDLVVLLPDAGEPDRLEQVASRCLERGWKVLPVLHLGEGEVVVGPYLVPTRPGCLRCFELRYKGIDHAVMAANALFQSRRAPGCPRSPDPSPTFQRWLAAEVAHMAAQAAAQELDPGTLFVFSEGAFRRARMVPHPGCETCGRPIDDPGRAAASDWALPDVGEPDLDRVIASLGPLIDPRVGLVAEPPEGAQRIDVWEPGAWRVHRVSARFAIPWPDGVRGPTTNWSQGTAVDPRQARIAALAEGLERYCGLMPRRPDRTAPFRVVEHEAVCPTELPLYSPRQYAEAGFPYRPFDPDEPLEWSLGFDLVRGRPRLVPLCCVQYGAERGRLADNCSSGMAAHSSRSEALARATLELVERDAFMIHWLNRIPPALIDLLDAEGNLAGAIRHRLTAVGYTLAASDITSDLGIPTILVSARRTDGGGPALIVGASAHPQPEIALEKAALEVFAAYQGSLERSWQGPKVLADVDVQTLEDHADAYTHPAWLDRASFLWTSQEVIPLHEVGRGRPVRAGTGQPLLADLRDTLERNGMELIGIDMTSPEIATTSLHIVRAVVPGLLPIGFGPHGLRLGGRRLYEAPVRMGLRSSPTNEADLYRTPHCFP